MIIVKMISIITRRIIGEIVIIQPARVGMPIVMLPIHTVIKFTILYLVNPILKHIYLILNRVVILRHHIATIEPALQFIHATLKLVEIAVIKIRRHTTAGHSAILGYTSFRFTDLAV